MAIFHWLPITGPVNLIMKAPKSPPGDIKGDRPKRGNKLETWKSMVTVW